MPLHFEEDHDRLVRLEQWSATVTARLDSMAAADLAGSRMNRRLARKVTRDISAAVETAVTRAVTRRAALFVAAGVMIGQALGSAASDVLRRLIAYLMQGH